MGHGYNSGVLQVDKVYRIDGEELKVGVDHDGFYSLNLNKKRVFNHIFDADGPWRSPLPKGPSLTIDQFLAWDGLQPSPTSGPKQSEVDVMRIGPTYNRIYCHIVQEDKIEIGPDRIKTDADVLEGMRKLGKLCIKNEKFVSTLRSKLSLSRRAAEQREILDAALSLMELQKASI